MLRKGLGIIAGFARRAMLLPTLPAYNYVFIHREAAPIGPPVFEWVIAKVFGKRIIYDFDDAIWIPNTSAANRIAADMKFHNKVDNICRWAYRNSCGNAYLAAYARQFNPNTVINPTTIDTIRLHNRTRNQTTPGKLIIGWTGTHSTLKYLLPVLPVLAQLEAEGLDFEFRVISNQAPELPMKLKSLNFMPWNKMTEIDDLLSFHFGLMPLEDDPWAKGKCAFKALQYMALGMPAIVSPVGMNSEVVQNGCNGYVCVSQEEWYSAIKGLLLDPVLRTELGKAARRTVKERYSVESNSANFLNLFS
ncbi:glycosyltransferase [Hymenobacter antarcticus]|uniref:Glycosyltransferase n=2 Tax=Hymenobacter antarcticus TaxID=486270 RepID=A0ABP7R4X6_9BACT